MILTGADRCRLFPNYFGPCFCEFWEEATVSPRTGLILLSYFYLITVYLIAGTHNSFTFCLDESGSVTPCASDAVRGLVTLFGALAKKIVGNWSKTQSLDVIAQLRAGVRYFDIRVSGKPGSSTLHVVHGLYGPPVDSCLDSLAAFLDQHRYEIVLLDFNHFYDMDSAAHDRLVQAVIDRLPLLSLCRL